MSVNRKIMVVGIAATVVAGGVTGLVMASPATATTSIREGHGINIEHGQDHVGYYYNNGHKFYCIEPLKGLSRSQSWVTATSLSHLGSTKSRELEFVLWKHGNTDSNSVAASVSQALNTIVGNKKDVARRAHYLSKSVNALAKAYISEAVKYRGGDVVSVKFTSTALVGQTGTATVSLVSGDRAGLSGSKLSLTAVNASVARSVTTNSKGVATLQYTRTGTGTVGVFAKASGLAPTTMLVSKPARGQQQLLSYVGSSSASGSAHYQKVAGMGTTRYSCPTICNGRPPVSTTFCHAAHEATRKYVVYDNGRAVKTIIIRQSSGASCQTVTVVIPDTHAASFKCSYDVSGKWSALATCGKTVVVDCPPWPVVNQSLSCSCTSGNIELSLPKNTTKHNEAIVYSLNGGSMVTKVARPGASLVVNIPFDRSKSSTDVVFNGEVQRNSGAYTGGGHEEVIVRQI